jgi:hypothetical protein
MSAINFFQKQTKNSQNLSVNFVDKAASADLEHTVIKPLDKSMYSTLERIIVLVMEDFGHEWDEAKALVIKEVANSHYVSGRH